MPYEVYNPQGNTMGGVPTMTISWPGRGRKSALISLNITATRIFLGAKIKAALLLWDRENRRIAIRGVEDTHPQALSLTFNSRQNQATLSGVGFLDYIGVDMLEPASIRLTLTWDGKEKIFEAVLPKEYLTRPRARKEPK